MKIIALKVENFKKLRAVEIKFSPTGISYIQGKNQAGKTSVLDAIEYLFRGKSVTNQNTISNGENKMVGEIDLDEFIIKRVQTEKSDRLEIRDKRGFTMNDKPQAFLDSLFNELTFNPFPFLRKTAEQKLKFLMDFFNLNVEEINEEIKNSETERRIVGRDLKAIGTPTPVDEVKPIDVNVLFEKRRKLEKKRNEELDAIRVFNAEQDNKTQKIEFYQREINNRVRRIDGIMEQIERLKAEADGLSVDIGEMTRKTNEIKVEAKKEFHSSVDLSEIDNKIANVQTLNSKADAYKNYLRELRAYEDKKAEYDRYTRGIEDLRNKKAMILKNANLPVSGLEIREDGVYYNGTFSENLSDSESIRLSLELCQAMRPKLQAVCVDRGESFDATQRLALEAWSKENGIQVIFTRVVDDIPTDSNDNMFFIENGQLI